MKKNKNLKVAIVMGSQSDFKTMKLSAKILKTMGIKFETKIISAHRTPKRMYEFAENASKTISFSDMEFSHEVFRVMLLEQVYRANCIFNNHPYHQS